MSLTEIIKKSITLSDKADDTYVKFLGNRVTVATYVAGIYGGVIAAHGIFAEGPIALLEFALGGMTFVGSHIVAKYLTAFGQSTFEYYKRTEKHIKQFGKLKRRYLKKLINKEIEADSFYGYCETQGAYLAARKYGQLDVFKEVKKKYSKNKIPNF